MDLKKIVFFFCLLFFSTCIYGQTNNTKKGAAIIYTQGVPNMVPRLAYDSEWAIDINTSQVYRYNRTTSQWSLAGSFVGRLNSNSAPSGAPQYGQPLFILNSQYKLYYWTGNSWVCINCSSVTTINTDSTLDGDGSLGDPLKIAQQGASTGQVLKWTGTTWYPSNDLDSLSNNELQQIDTFLLSNDTLYLSLSKDSVAAEYVVLSGLGGGNGIYGGSDTIPDLTYAFADSAKTFAIGQFPSFPTLTTTGTSQGFYYKPSSSVKLLNGDNTTNYRNELSLESTISRLRTLTNTGSNISSLFQRALPENVTQTSTVTADGNIYGNLNIVTISDSIQELIVLNQSGSGDSVGVTMYLGKGHPNSSYHKISDRSWGIKTEIPLSDEFHWMKIYLPGSEDTTGNNIELYEKYRFPNEEPSQVLNDSSFIVWIGNGTTTVPQFIELSSISSGNQTLSIDSLIVSGKERFTVDISGGNSISFDVDINTDNQIIDTFTIVSNILRASLSNDGQPFKSVDLSPYLDNTDAQTLTIDSTAVVGDIERFELTISNGNTVYFDVTTGANGIYGGSDIIPGGTEATITNDAGFSFNYDNSNIGFSISDDVGIELISDDGFEALSVFNGTGVEINASALTVANSDGISSGLLRILEPAGTNYLIFRSQNMTVDRTFTWPAVYGTSGNFLTTNGSGTLSWSAEVDGSVSNELQTITNTSNATSHTVTLSSSGGSVQLVEGSNITLTTSGTASDGVVTIAATSGSGTDLSFSGASSPVTLLSSTGTDVTFTAGGINTMTATGTDLTITATEVDGSITNEGSLTVGAGGGNSSTIVSNTSGSTAVTVEGSGIVTVTESGSTITITGTEVDGSTTNEIQTVDLFDLTGTTLSISLSSDGQSPSTVAFTNWDTDVTNDLSGSGVAPRLAIWSGTQSLTSSATLTYQTNTMSFLPAAKDTIIYVLGESSNYFGLSTLVDTFNGAATAYKLGALNQNGRVYLTAFETYLQTPLRQVDNKGIEFKGSTGSLYLHANGDYYTATLGGDNQLPNRNLTWYFVSGGLNKGSPMVFQHIFATNDTTNNSFEFLARNTAVGGITHPDSTLMRIGNWDRGTALEIKHNGNIGVGTRVPTRDLDVNGETRIRDLTTTNPTLLIGTDADGVLSAVTLGSNLSFTGTTLNATAGLDVNIYDDDGNVQDGGTIVDVSGDDPIILNLDASAAQTNRMFRLVTDYSADDATTYFIEMVAPIDSLKVISFDDGIEVKYEGTSGFGTGFTISSNVMLSLTADSIIATTLPARTVVHQLVGMYGNTVSRIEGTANDQVLKWDETNGYWEIGTVASSYTEGEYYVESQTGTSLDLSTGTLAITKSSGTTVNLNFPTDRNKVDIYKNGLLLGYTDGTTTRDYSYNDTTEVVTFAVALVSSDRLTIKIRSY